MILGVKEVVLQSRHLLNLNVEKHELKELVEVQTLFSKTHKITYHRKSSVETLDRIAFG